MNANSEITNFGSWMSSIQRGAALFAGLAGVLGGIAGTIDWPVVGTFFGAVEGALAGAVVGVIDAAALTLLAGWPRRVVPRSTPARSMSRVRWLSC